MIASTDETNRRWGEGLALLEQMQLEIADLQAALAKARTLGSGLRDPGVDTLMNNNNNIVEGVKSECNKDAGQG